MREKVPTWLTAAQNGAIGEARTKAFLLDRFWVLERSVDVEGADFIIQRRLTQRNLLDRDAPRLGFVQAKFFASSSTSHYVPEAYVLDTEGEPRSEFFLVCHTGDEHDPRMFFLTTREIVENFVFTATEGSKEKTYRIGGTQLLKSAQFAGSNRKFALDRMDHALELADFRKNRSFLSWLLPSARIDTGAIDPLYREPIENDWGDIPQAFLKLKKSADRAMGHLEAIHGKLAEIVESSDPEAALKLVQDTEWECEAGRPYSGWSITAADGFKDQEFEAAVRQHKDMVVSLKTHGLLDAFIELSGVLKRELVSYILPKMPIVHTAAHVLQIQYEADTLREVVLHSQLEDAEKYRHEDPHSFIPPCEGLIEARLGLIRYWWIPGIYAVDETDLSAGWEGHITQTMPTRRIMAALYKTHFGPTR
jgi:hypothetical protein